MSPGSMMRFRSFRRDELASSEPADPAHALRFVSAADGGVYSNHYAFSRTMRRPSTSSDAADCDRKLMLR
jgi:hypothetical protein